ncbi:TetR/AcrR family transcriptional regulator [Niveispirillum sp.]|uniref:TetR/AcrR family transcriptional regulator n=1 Tax=Niveispirillum sp. TaxID=1917217 RepID=UPI0025F8BBB4|nr:TetR/AcrR family transcriptional regulator [Niveispirillum sp.]
MPPAFPAVLPGNKVLSSQRLPTQARSRDTRNRIVEGAVRVLAEKGIAGLTHREVARAAHVSLASTTYHFCSKFDILAAVSQSMFDQDTLLLKRLESTAVPVRPAGGPRRWVLDLLRHSAGRSRVRAACWVEMVLDAPRHPEALALAREWFGAAATAWHDWASGGSNADADLLARSCGDLAVGLLLMILVLGLDEKAVLDVLDRGLEPRDCWRRDIEMPLAVDTIRSGEKAIRTREAILAATLDELVSKGQSAIGLKTMARKAGLSPSAASYHFSSTPSLLAAAQRRLFEDAKARYRAVVSPERDVKTLDQLIDRTAVIFLREATEFARESLAVYTVWLEASRQPELRPMIWKDIENQHLAWRRLMEPLAPTLRSIDPLLPQALYTGKLIRIVATGSQARDLANVRAEFAYDLAKITTGNFWL